MSIEVRELEIPGLFEITPQKFGDDRGFFSETYNATDMANAGLNTSWLQDNHSYSAEAGVLRGLHYQLPPFTQDKLVRVARGRVFDVVVDIRKGSPTSGRWVSIELSAGKWNQLYVPRGFAHGFLTLEEDTEFVYKVSQVYNHECDRSIRYDDPTIAVDWPLDGLSAILSEKDKAAPLLKDAELPESWDQ